MSEKKEEKPVVKGRRTFLATAVGTIVGAIVTGVGVWALTPKGIVEVPKEVIKEVTTTAAAVTHTVTTTTTAPAVTKEVTKEVTVTAPSVPVKPLKVAALSAEPRDDNGWGYQCLMALQKAKEVYGAEYHMTEGVVAPADVVRITEDYLAKGYNAFYGNGFHLGEAWHREGITIKNPDVLFVWSCLEANDPNGYSTVYCDEEHAFMGGVVAGLLTKTGTVGVIGGMVSPCANSFVNGFTLGAKAARPDVEVLQAFAGTWIDPAKGKDMTISMIDEGADVMHNYASYTGVGSFEACEERKVYTFGCFLDQSSFAPNTMVHSAHFNHWKGFNVGLTDWLAGKMEGRCTWAKYSTGYFWNVPNPKVWNKLPEDIRSKIEYVEARLKGRSLDPYLLVPRFTDLVPIEELPTPPKVFL